MPASSGRDCVVFDLDDTLLHGDSGARLIRHLIERIWWRRVLAVLIAPIGILLMRFDASFAIGASLFLWVATVGMTETTMTDAVKTFARTHAPARIEVSIAALQAELDAGNDVIVATGAFQALAECLIAQLQLRGRPRVVGSLIGRRAGGFVAAMPARGKFKMIRLARLGVHPPFARAWSDSALDLPLLRAAEQAHWVTRYPKVPRRVQQALPNLIVHRIDNECAA